MRAGQRVGDRVHDRELQVRAQGGGRGLREHVGQAFEQARVLDVDGVGGAGAERVEVARQVDPRCERGERRTVEAVVHPVRVPALLGAQMQRRETRLELEHRRSLRGVAANVGELRGDVLDVRRAQGHGRGAVVEVGLAVRQAEPGLGEPQQVLARVVVIGGHAPAQQREDPRAVQRRQQRRHVVGGADRAQQRLDRLDAGRLDRGQVQAGGEMVAEQPVDGVDRLGRGALEQLAEDDLVAPADLLERAPGPVAGGDRVGVEPTPIGEAVEVDAGVGGRVTIRGGKAH